VCMYFFQILQPCGLSLTAGFLTILNHHRQQNGGVEDICIIMQTSLTLSTFPRVPQAANDYSICLPDNWKHQISPADQQWIGHSLYVGKGKLNESAFKLWWYPPDIPSGKPKAESYHIKCLFLWAPRCMWMVDECEKSTFQCSVDLQKGL